MEIKKIAADAIRYRAEIGMLMESLDAREVEQGLLVLKATLLSRDLKPFILNQAGDMIRDYKIQFENGQIQIWASIDAKQMGPVEVEYKITVAELRFDDTGHKLYATFQETANPLGNMVQKLAFKAALLNGPLIKTAIKLGNISYLYIDGNNLFLDLDRLSMIEKLPEGLSLNYVSAKDGKLTLSFR